MGLDGIRRSASFWVRVGEREAVAKISSVGQHWWGMKERVRKSKKMLEVKVSWTTWDAEARIMVVNWSRLTQGMQDTSGKHRHWYEGSKIKPWPCYTSFGVRSLLRTTYKHASFDSRSQWLFTGPVCLQVMLICSTLFQVALVHYSCSFWSITCCHCTCVNCCLLYVMQFSRGFFVCFLVKLSFAHPIEINSIGLNCSLVGLTLEYIREMYFMHAQSQSSNC